MKTTSAYPVILTADVVGTSAFYQQHFGFTPAFEADWYVHLTSTASPESNLAILHHQHHTIPEPGRAPTTGLILNFEVENVDAEYARLSAAGLEMLQPLRSEVFGQRHFITRDPNGILLDIITPIEPAPDMADQFTPTSS